MPISTNLGVTTCATKVMRKCTSCEINWALGSKRLTWQKYSTELNGVSFMVDIIPATGRTSEGAQGSKVLFSETCHTGYYFVCEITISTYLVVDEDTTRFRAHLFFFQLSQRIRKTLMYRVFSSFTVCAPFYPTTGLPHCQDQKIHTDQVFYFRLSFSNM